MNGHGTWSVWQGRRRAGDLRFRLVVHASTEFDPWKWLPQRRDGHLPGQGAILSAAYSGCRRRRTKPLWNCSLTKQDHIIENRCVNGRVFRQDCTKKITSIVGRKDSDNIRMLVLLLHTYLDEN